MCPHLGVAETIVGAPAGGLDIAEHCNAGPYQGCQLSICRAGLLLQQLLALLERTLLTATLHHMMGKHVRLSIVRGDQTCRVVGALLLCVPHGHAA